MDLKFVFGVILCGYVIDDAFGHVHFVKHGQLHGYEGHYFGSQVVLAVRNFGIGFVVAFVQVKEVKLQEGVDGNAAHGNKIHQEHQVAEIDKSLVLKGIKKRTKTVNKVV